MIKQGQILYHVSRDGHIEIAKIKKDEAASRVLIEIENGHQTEFEVSAQSLFNTLGRAAVQALKNRKVTYYRAQQPDVSTMVVVR